MLLTPNVGLVIREFAEQSEWRSAAAVAAAAATAAESRLKKLFSAHQGAILFAQIYIQMRFYLFV